MKVMDAQKSLASLLVGLCFLLILTACTGGKETSSQTKAENAQTKPNVIFILVDTLRADHLSYAGYPRETSPNIDKLAGSSTIFKYAYSASCWTAPAVASIFSGLPPSVHGMMPPNSRVKAAQKYSFKLSSDVPTIAESLKANGYKTAAVAANEWISDKFGYTQGFDYFFVKSRMIGEDLNEKAFRVIDKFYDPAQPFFLYVHYMDPHDPYRAPKPYNTFFKEPLSDPRYKAPELELMRQYDNEIRYVDFQIGEFLKYAEAKGLLRNSVIVLTADHGEQFRERGHVGHGYNLNDEETHIPLLIKEPGQTAGNIVETAVSHLDIFPTLLGLTHAPEMSGLPGISLFGNALNNRPISIVSEVARRYNFKAIVEPSRNKVIATYDIELGLYAPLHKEQKLQYFDLAKDPFESAPQDLMSQLDKAPATDFYNTYDKLLKDIKRYRVDSMEMSDDTLKELKSLGYF